MNGSRPVLPRQIADIIEDFRSQQVSTRRIIRLALEGGAGPSASTLHAFACGTMDGLDTLLAALVNGYEVEKSAEELRQEAYDKIRGRYLYWLDNSQHGNDYALAANGGLTFVLNTLGIKISGVNAPEEDAR